MSFIWCGELTETLNYFQIKSAVYRPDREDRTIIAASGEFNFRSGEGFSVDDMAERLVVSTRSELPISDDRAIIFVRTGQSPKEFEGIRASFDIDSTSRFAATGDWMSTDGDVISGRPCNG
ncbi:hypothetical protein [Microbacterium testaceum]|uniref:hypothetical protein n=1 Tax=Microbacterium testaceum TaxID=2033 RepID=UPI00128F20BB|nr:hypothetical protein [Microbacterium testaceum]